MKKLILGLSFLSLAPSSCYPMAAASPATKRIATELLKKGIEMGSTALHWAIAAGPCWEPIVSQLLSWERQQKIKEMHKKLSNSPYYEKERNWIRQELKAQGFKNWDSILLMSSDDWAVQLLSGTQVLAYPFKLRTALEDNNIEKLNSHKGSLSHEKTHLEKHHYEKSLGLAITIPFVTHVVWNRIFTTSKFNSNFALRNFFKIITGLSKAQINLMSIWFLKYWHEKEADEGVINDPIVLQAYSEFFKAAEQKYKRKGWTEGMLFADVHPHPLKRAQRFEERANELLTKQYVDGQKRTALLRAAQQKV